MAEASNGDPSACENQDEPKKCLNNPYVEINKTKDTYRLTLVLNDQNITFNFKCNAICDACKSIKSIMDSGSQIYYNCNGRIKF